MINIEKVELKNKNNHKRPYYPADNVRLVYSGNDYFQRLEKIIDDSKFELHIQTYKFDNDSTGLSIIEKLKNAADRNVKIFILLDSFGSSNFPNYLKRELRDHGINLRFFAPLLSTHSFYLGRRLHHKVVTADNEIALIGGINIADKYHGTSLQLPWLDYAVELKGSICQGIQKFCNNIYHKRSYRKIKSPTEEFNIDKTLIRIAINDWVNNKTEISKSYLTAIRKAKHEIIIVGGYFIPGRRIRIALRQASKRGVKVKIILAGISDIKLVARATEFFYSYLLRHNIELYEWRGSVLHGKAAVIDNEWSTIGSFNLNHLSSYASIEMNVEIDSAEFSNVFVTHLYEIISRCRLVSRVTYESKNIWLNKLLNWISFRLIRISSFVLTLFSYHRIFKRRFMSSIK